MNPNSPNHRKIKARISKAMPLLILVLYLALGACCYRLYLRQAINYSGPLGNYMSDLPEHIADGVNGTAYSLMELSFGFLMGTLGFNQKAVAIWLSLVTLATIFVTWKFLCRINRTADRNLLHIGAFICMMVTPIHVQSLFPSHYLGLQSGSIWHNSTYMGMKLACMLVLTVYVDLQDRYEKKYTMWDFLLFTFLLILVNLMKPNFIICFAPAMAIMLLTDCIHSRGKTLKQQIQFGIPVLLSLGVVIYQTLFLFTGERSDSSIAFNFGFNLLLRTSHPVWSILLSSAFPFLILLMNGRDLHYDRGYRVIWLTWAAAMFEYLCLMETGARQTHGNLSWGICLCQFLVFVISIGKLLKQIQRCRNLMQKKDPADHMGNSLTRKTGAVKLSIGHYFYILLTLTAIILLILHLQSGMKFFVNTFLGADYYQ